MKSVLMGLVLLLPIQPGSAPDTAPQYLAMLSAGMALF